MVSSSNNFLSQMYDRRGLWLLFSVCAFPPHLWTLILSIQDISWVTERTNSWDAFGVISYGLFFALIESLLVFIVATMVVLVFPRSWKSNKRIGFVMVLILILSIWAIIGQLFFFWNINLPGWAVALLIRLGHPLRYLYLLALSLVLPSVILPVYYFLKSERALANLEEISDRLSLLVSFYLFLDVIGIIIIAIRNF